MTAYAYKFSVVEGRDECQLPEVLLALRPEDNNFYPHLTTTAVPYQDEKEEKQDGRRKDGQQSLDAYRMVENQW